VWTSFSRLRVFQTRSWAAWNRADEAGRHLLASACLGTPGGVAPFAGLEHHRLTGAIARLGLIRHGNA
jgi:hypothetical protein